MTLSEIDDLIIELIEEAQRQNLYFYRELGNQEPYPVFLDSLNQPPFCYPIHPEVIYTPPTVDKIIINYFER